MPCTSQICHRCGRALSISRNKRYAKLISDEKEKATKLGFLDGVAAPAKKRAASGGGRAAKKAKTDENGDAAPREDGDGESCDEKE